MTVKVISFRELQRLTVKELQSYDQVIITVDGEETFKLIRIDSQANIMTAKLPPVDSQRNTKKLIELPLSKKRQADSIW